MKKSILITAISLIPALALAQISYDFTAGEAFINGTLDGQNGWNAGETASFTVDTSGSGTLILGPTSTQFPNAAKFSALSANNYSGVMDFTLNYGVGSSSVFGSVPILPTIEFTQFTGGFERISFNTMRQTGTDAYNTSLSATGLTTTSGSNFGPGFNFAAVGLAVDGSNLFTDGDSDNLRLEFSAALTGTSGAGDEWSADLTLTNLDTTTVLSTVSITLLDENGVFGANAHAFRFVPSNMQSNDVEIRADSISVSEVPEPSAFALLAGVLGLGWVMIRRRRSV